MPYFHTKRPYQKPEANVNTNRVASTKCTSHKEQSFVTNNTLPLRELNLSIRTFINSLSNISIFQMSIFILSRFLFEVVFSRQVSLGTGHLRKSVSG